jgi:hypothetical protein
MEEDHVEACRRVQPMSASAKAHYQAHVSMEERAEYFALSTTPMDAAHEQLMEQVLVGHFAAQKN